MEKDIVWILKRFLCSAFFYFKPWAHTMHIHNNKDEKWFPISYFFYLM